MVKHLGLFLVHLAALNRHPILLQNTKIDFVWKRVKDKKLSEKLREWGIGLGSLNFNFGNILHPFRRGYCTYFNIIM